MKILHVALFGASTLCAAAQAADIRPGTEVVVAPADELSSRDVKKGDLFAIVVASDVVQDGAIVIPRGTPGRGRVTWKTGKSVYGKSGKFEFDLVDLSMPSGSIPIAGHYRVEGKGETGVTVAVTVIGGLAAGAAVVGHDAVADRGVRWAARVAAPVAVPAAVVSPIAFASAASPVQVASLAPAADPYRAGRDAALAARAGAERED